MCGPGKSQFGAYRHGIHDPSGPDRYKPPRIARHRSGRQSRQVAAGALERILISATISSTSFFQSSVFEGSDIGGPTAIDPEKIDHAKRDLVILKMAPIEEDKLPRRILSLNIAPDWAEENKIIFTIGYPGDPGPARIEELFTLLEQLFKSTIRLQTPGSGQMVVKSINNNQPWGSAHDATKTGRQLRIGGTRDWQGICSSRFALRRHAAYRAKNWAHIIGNTLQTKDANGKMLKEWLDQYQVDMVDTI